jgi:hypothetical protein
MQHLAIEPTASLAQCALLQGDMSTALTITAGILEQFSRGLSLDGTEEPLRVSLICYQVLDAANDLRATHVLASAHVELQSRALKISNESRRESYLLRVPFHAMIINQFNRKYSAQLIDSESSDQSTRT